MSEFRWIELEEAAHPLLIFAITQVTGVASFEPFTYRLLKGSLYTLIPVYDCLNNGVSSTLPLYVQ